MSEFTRHPQQALSWKHRCPLLSLILVFSLMQGCKGIGKAVSRGASKAATEAGSVGAEFAVPAAESGMEAWADRKERKERIKEARVQWKPRAPSQRSAYENTLLAKTNSKLDRDDPKAKDAFCGNPKPNLGGLPVGAATFSVDDSSEMTLACREVSQRLMPSPEVCHLVFEDGDGRNFFCFGRDTEESERVCHTLAGLLWFHVKNSELKQACGSIFDNIKDSLKAENQRVHEMERGR